MTLVSLQKSLELQDKLSPVFYKIGENHQPQVVRKVGVQEKSFQ